MAVLMGMISGSGAADTQFVATLTKPLYEKVGYDIHYAAGIVATVGTIAYITPPVLGSIAFLMVELLSIPYSRIIVMTLGPMLLYLFGIVTYNELYVRKVNLPQTTLSSEIDFSYFKRYCYAFVPILFIIVMIYRGNAISVTVSSAAALFVIFAFVDKSVRPPVKNLFDALSEGIIFLLPIASAVIAANMIMTMMVMSGLASKFSLFLMNASGSSLLFATLFTGFFSILLGMGVPPIATYVLTSALTAPAIQKLAVMNGIPENVALMATAYVSLLLCCAGGSDSTSSPFSLCRRLGVWDRPHQDRRLRCPGSPYRSICSGSPSSCLSAGPASWFFLPSRRSRWVRP